MRILVLGGTAWLGAEIVRDAVRRGHDVTALARGASGAVPHGARVVVADRTAIDAYDEVATLEWDAVLDVSRQPGQVRGAVAALAGRTRYWVFVSTCSVYVPQLVFGADESAPLKPALDGDVMTSMEQYGEAKVACEAAVLAGLGPERSFVARVSLIGGPGDRTGRTTYWPWRLAHPSGRGGQVLVPDAPEVPVQVIDVRDLAGFLVDAAERRLTGIANVGGETRTLAEHLEAAQRAAGAAVRELVAADEDWLAERGVEYWAGPRSLPLWLRGEDLSLGSHDTSRAESLGLWRRPLEETLRDGVAALSGAPVGAGLSDDDERELLAELLDDVVDSRDS